MRPLSPTDLLFLIIERRNQPMHVGGLILIRPPEGRDAREFAADIARRAREASRAYAPFNQKLVQKLGLWFWQTDKEFDIEMHVNHVGLPKPGRIRELLALVSKLHSGLMDRTKPLWEMYVIEGVEDGRVGLYFKIHHSMMDGVAGARMMVKAMSVDPDNPQLTPVWAMPPSDPDKHAPKIQSQRILPMLKATFNEQKAALPKVAGEIYRSLKERRDGDVSVFQAPPSVLNQAISGSRRFAAQSWELQRIKNAAKVHGVTLNDIVLAMCSSALRSYLADLGELPDRSLIAMVPVSLRRDDSDSGNQVAMVLADLATTIEHPIDRLHTITKSMTYAKKRFSGMTPVEIVEYVATTMAISGVNVATGLVPTRQAFNIVISNVPGPKEKLYYAGGAVEGIYPVSIVIDGQAINITLESYADKLEVGVIACSRTLPSMQKILHYLEEGLAELEMESPDALTP